MALDKKSISGMGRSLPNMQSQKYKKKLQQSLLGTQILPDVAIS